MNLKTKFKNFFTLTPKANDGFTLVELIVVIAILAILGGVGIPAYSGYITKANKQADMSLVSDIAYALTLAGYNGTFDEGDGGYMVLSTTGVSGVDAGSPLDQALTAAFGAGYPDMLKLKYDKWGNSGLADDLTGQMAYAVKNSSYMTGGRVDELLNDVEKMTGMAQHLVTAIGSTSDIGKTLSGLFSADVLNETGKKYGVNSDNWTEDQWEAWGRNNQVAYGNLLVLAAADDIENSKSNRGECSSASNMIMEFSSYYAFAAMNPEFSKVLDEKLSGLQSIDSASAGADWYEELEGAANTYGYNKYKYETDADGNVTNVLSEKYMLDKAAFGSMMSGLGNPSEEQAKILAGDLNNANLFTTGVGNTMYNDYMDAVETISCMPFNVDGVTVGENEIAVMYAQTPNGTVLFNSLPTGQE